MHIYAIVVSFGGDTARIRRFQTVNQGQTIFVPILDGYLAITADHSEYDVWRDALTKLSAGESAEIDFGRSDVALTGQQHQRRWLLFPLPAEWQRAYEPSAVIDWPRTDNKHASETARQTPPPQ